MVFRLIAKWASAAICGLYAVLFILVTFKHFHSQSSDWIYPTAFILTVLLIPILLTLITRTKITDHRLTFVSLLILCLLVKVIWVLNNPTAPAVDYLTFYKTAQMLAESWSIDFHYVALFSHIMGYASFLSLFFIVFGDGVLVAPVVNAVLSVVSMGLIYYIGYRLWNRKAAVIASILWIFFPSQTIYNAMVLSEPWYTTLILAFWALMIRLFANFEEHAFWKIALTGLASSLILGLINASRPLAPILCIALVIWIVVSMDPKHMKVLWRKLGLLLVIAVGLWSFNQLNTAYNSARLGEPAASSTGYTLYVGFNEESRGKWNQEDSEHFYHYVDNNPDWTAVDVQRQMLKDAKDRILSGNVDYLGLFYDKLHLLWNDDAMAYRYSDIRDNEETYTDVSNIYYFFTMILSVIGAIILISRKYRSPGLMLCLFVLGLTCAHMLAEVAYRYHYSGIPVMTVLAGIGISGLGSWILRVKRNP